MIDNPWFFVAALPAVFINGVSKGGFGSGLGIVSVPMMALTIPVPEAAAIMLPILCIMDLAALWTYRRSWDRENMKIMLPAGLVGLVLGALTFGFISEAGLKLVLGTVAVGFVLYHWSDAARQLAKTHPSRLKGYFWCCVSGYTSTVAHAGGPPMSIYLLPQRMDKALLAGTAVVFFAVLNYLKLVPYFWLGMFDAQNLTTSAALAPIGVIGIFTGVWIRKRINEVLFYRLCYGFLLLTGGKLLYDSISKLI
jgi:uncharacterized membrane protein YfcA